MKHAFKIGLLSAALAVVGSANAQLATVIFSNIQTSPTSIVPDTGGLVRFKVGTTSQFDRAWGSENGNHWVLRALANVATTADEMVITGSGVTSTGAALRAREGSTAQWDASRTLGVIRQQCAINNLGHYAFSVDLSGVTTNDDVIVKGTGSTHSVWATEGTAIPGSADFYGSTNDSLNMSNDGNVWFRSAFLVGATGEEAIVRLTGPGAGSQFMRTSTTFPGSQLPPNEAVDSFLSNNLRVSGSGTNSINGVDLTGPTTTDLLTIVGANSVAQEGVVLPGSAFVNVVSSMDTAGGTRQLFGNRYAFRGSNAIDAIDWVYGNGAVLAATDTPITPGSGELWDDAPFAATYFVNTVNGIGDFIVGGTTNNANASLNAVLVLNGQKVLMREGDAVDVDGNGLADDNAFLQTFNNDDSFLTNDGRYYFMADLKNAVDANIGQAFMWKSINAPSLTYTLVQGFDTGGTLNDFLYADDKRFNIANDEFDTVAEVHFSATSQTSAITSLSLRSEYSATRPGLSYRLDAWNFNTASWTPLGLNVPTILDQFVSRTISANATNYVNGVTNEVRGRARFIPDIDIDAADGWLCRIDHFSFLPL